MPYLFHSIFPLNTIVMSSYFKDYLIFKKLIYFALGLSVSMNWLGHSKNMYFIMQDGTLRRYVREGEPLGCPIGPLKQKSRMSLFRDLLS